MLVLGEQIKLKSTCNVLSSTFIIITISYALKHWWVIRIFSGVFTALGIEVEIPEGQGLDGAFGLSDQWKLKNKFATS